MSAEPDPAAEVGTELLIDQLDRDVQYVIVTGEIPIRRYLDGARQLMLQGDKSFLANDYAAAYKSYKKFVRLVLVDLKKHMFYSSANNKKEIDELNGFAWDALKNKLETKIAPKIQGRRVPIRGGATAAPAAAAGDDTETADLTARLSALAMSKTTGDGGAAGATVPAPASLVSAAPASSLASIYTPKPPAGSLTAASVPLADSAVGQASSRGMRPLHLPVALIAKFKALCEANTAAGIETCALLMGKEVDVIGAAPVAVAAPAAPAVKKANADMTEEEAMAALAGGGDGDAKPAAASASSAAAATAPGTLVVTHMVLPEQRGTANSVETFNEEAIVAVQEQHGVYVMGWVHTHPTQTCFLSSVDLHCQCSYQNMLPEAVAMVIAPKYNETGIFHLTKGGMDVLTECKEPSGQHHPHRAPASDDGFLYVHTAHTVLHFPRGHARYNAAAVPKIVPGSLAPGEQVDFGAVTVVDLRKNKGPPKSSGSGGGGLFSALFNDNKKDPVGEGAMYATGAGLKYPSIPAALKLR